MSWLILGMRLTIIPAIDARTLSLMVNMGASVASRAVNICAGIAIVSLAVRGLGPSGYGSLAAIIAASTFFAYADLGLGFAVVNHLTGSACEREGQKAVSRSFYALSSISLCATLLTLSAFSLIYLFHGNVPALPSVWLTCALLVSLGLPTGLAQRILFALQRNISGGLLNAAARLASVGSVWIAYHISNDPIVYLLATLAPPVTVGWISLAWLFFGSTPHLMPRKDDVQWHALKGDVLTGLKFTALQLAGYIEMTVDTVLVGLVSTSVVVAQFDVTSRLFFFIPAAVSLASSPLWPALRRAFDEGDVQWFNRVVSLSQLSTFFGSSAIALLLIIFHAGIIHAWTGADFATRWALLFALASASVLTATSTVQGMALNARNRLTEQTRFLLYGIPALLIFKIVAAHVGQVWMLAAMTSVYYVIRISFLRRFYN